MIECLGSVDFRVCTSDMIEVRGSSNNKLLFRIESTEDGPEISMKIPHVKVVYRIPMQCLWMAAHQLE